MTATATLRVFATEKKESSCEQVWKPLENLGPGFIQALFMGMEGRG
jgi:hypothetical protein